MTRTPFALLSALLIADTVLAQQRPSEFAAASDAFFDRWFAFYPTQASGAGLHEYDPMLGPRDRASIEAYITDLKMIEDRFEAMNEAALSPDERLDRDLILREIRGDLFWLEEVGTWRQNPRFYAAQWDLTLLLLLEYAPLEERAAAIVSRLDRFPALIDSARANVENPSRPFVEVALITYRGWPRFLRQDLTAALAGVTDPAFQERFEAARDRAVAAIEEYAEHLEREVLLQAQGEYALGPERYRRMNMLLAGVDLPNERLKSIAEAELARLEAKADSLAAVIAPAAPPQTRVVAAFDSLGLDKPEPHAIVAKAADVIEELKTFVNAADIGTVLPGSVEVREIPPFARTNFAYIWIPGPFEREANTGFYFIQPVEPNWSREVTQDFLARNNVWSILNTSAHEAYPGHYHHFNHVNRAPTRAQQLLTAYVTTEGWAHYTEEMSWEEGLAERSPKLGLAVVQDALLRVVRFLASIGLHTEGMSVEQAERMFAEIAHQDSVNARQQALRGTYDPEYLNYTLGKLMFLELRRESEAAARARGEEFDLGRFHDGLMTSGAPPVTWIGRRVLEDPGWAPFASEDR
jgi:uncharacterized protein (DUF885 family)